MRCRQVDRCRPTVQSDIVGPTGSSIIRFLERSDIIVSWFGQILHNLYMIKEPEHYLG